MLSLCGLGVQFKVGADGVRIASSEMLLRIDPVWSCVDAPVDARDLLTAPAMIGCGHVSGLEVRLCHMPRAGMEIRRPGADQISERRAR